ncbi:MAG TPA: winged helix-turn-helix domain-containing protein [Candidatus Saccharimonadales bacterium]|nr:winged helix-turn-helix domain-containing protein [Candidatus Saccharimonadales bacterium]
MTGDRSIGNNHYSFDRLHAQGVDSSTSIAIGNLQFSIADGTITGDGRFEQLTVMEAKVLLFLSSNPDVVLDKDTISQGVWGYSNTGRLVDVYVTKLRPKLDQKIRIETVRGAGFTYNSDAALLLKPQ